MADFDVAAIYGTVRRRLLELAPRLTEDQLSTTVPTCPAWTVQDVYAHLTGLAAEVVADVEGHPGSDSATARQVAARAGNSIGEICDEWRRTGPELERILEVEGKRRAIIAIDAWTHDQDVHNAVGLVSGRTGPGLELTVNSVWRLKRPIRDSGTAPFRVVTGSRDWVIGDSEPAATVRLDDYELARMVTARRSLAQMRSYDWDGDPEPYLEMIPFFTPPEHDIVE